MTGLLAALTALISVAALDYESARQTAEHAAATYRELARNLTHTDMPAEVRAALEDIIRIVQRNYPGSRP